MKDYKLYELGDIQLQSGEINIRQYKQNSRLWIALAIFSSQTHLIISLKTDVQLSLIVKNLTITSRLPYLFGVVHRWHKAAKSLLAHKKQKRQIYLLKRD